MAAYGKQKKQKLNVEEEPRRFEAIVSRAKPFFQDSLRIGREKSTEDPSWSSLTIRTLSPENSPFK